MRVMRASGPSLRDSTHAAARCMHVQAHTGGFPDTQLQHSRLHRMTHAPAHDIAFSSAGRPHKPAALDRERRSIRPNDDQVPKILTFNGQASTNSPPTEAQRTRDRPLEHPANTHLMRKTTSGKRVDQGSRKISPLPSRFQKSQCPPILRCEFRSDSCRHPPPEYPHPSQSSQSSHSLPVLPKNFTFAKKSVSETASPCSTGGLFRRSGHPLFPKILTFD